MSKIDNLHDRVYQLRLRRDSLDRFRTTEREEYEQRINELKRQIALAKTPPPEKRIVIDEIIKIRASDMSILYTDPVTELNFFTLAELQYHLERCKKGYRFFSESAVKKIKADREEKLGKKKVYPPSIKDLILEALKEKDHTLAELVARIKIGRAHV